MTSGKTKSFRSAFTIESLENRTLLSGSVPPPGFGNVVGSFNGVSAYSDGQVINHVDYDSGLYNSATRTASGVSKTITTGEKWQCVEYVNRYYFMHYGVDLRSNLPSTARNATNYFSRASTLGLSHFSNGGTAAPQAGDIICFGGGAGGFGHVAIVRDVPAITDGQTSVIHVIQENVTQTSRDNSFAFTFTKKSGKYSIVATSLGATYFCQGWLRIPSTVVSTPKISSVNPSPVIGSNSAQPLTIYGSNFVAGCTVTLRDLTTGQTFSNRTISSQSTTQITINPNFSTAADTWSVEVINPSGVSSGQYHFTVLGSETFLPAIYSVNPSPVTGSNSAQPFTIHGSNFVTGSTVTLRDLSAGQTFANRTISSQSSTQITINPNFSTAADTWSVEVINPGGVSSGQYHFSVTSPIVTVTPAIYSVNPSTVTGSNSAQPFTIYGGNFVSGCTVTLRDLTAGQTFSNRAISSQSSSQITINPNFSTAADTWSVEVINPGSVSSGQYYFAVTSPITAVTPAIYSVNPSTVIGSNSSQPFTIYGGNFVGGCTVTLRDLTAGQTFSNRAISYQSSTQITINPNFSTAADTWSVEVINPGGVSSGQYYFSVL